MPTQVQGLITPTYDPVVEVPANGEVITEAALTDTAVALGNRIEFVRSRVAEASGAPERVHNVLDDFHSPALIGNTLVSDQSWKVVLAGAPVFTFISATSKNPGNFAIFFPGDSSTHEFYWFLQDDGANIANLSLVDSTVIVAMIPLDGGVAMQCFWGWSQDGDLLNGGDNSLSLSYSTFEANWRVFMRKATVSTFIDTGVPAVVGEYVVCRFLLLASGDIDVEINGVVTNTILAANLPVVDMTFGGRAVVSVADAAPASFATDFMFFTATTPARNGP